MHPLTEQLPDLVGITRDILEILRQVIGGAGIQGVQTDPRALVGERREHQHGGGAALHDFPYSGDAVHDRHLVVHGNHIRTQRQCLLHGFAPVGSGAYHLDLCVARENLRHPAPEKPGVVHYQHLDCHRLSALLKLDGTPSCDGVPISV